MRLNIGVLVAAVVVSVPSSVNAQRERIDSTRREACERMVLALRAGPGDPGYIEGMALAANCEVSGGPALAERWTKITGEDSRDLAQLLGRSRALPDRALLARAIELVQDPARAPAVRIAVINLLISYYAPGRTLSPEYQAGDRNPELCGLGSRVHFRPNVSANPFGPEARPLILETLNAVAEAPGNELVRRAAACAWYPLMRLAEREGRSG